MNKYITYLTIIAAAYSFNAMASETTPLLKDSKQEIVDHDHLNEMPLPVQLHILEYIAADSKDGLKTIKALTKTNKNFHKLCSNLDPLSNARDPELEKLLAQHLKPTPKNAKKIFEIVQKNNDQTTQQKVYESMDYQSGWIDNCQDCCVCTLPWFQSPWEQEWDETCQKNYTKRIKQKYGFIPANILGHGNYEKYKESRKHYLGAGACLLMWSARTATQVLCCPVCVCAYATGHDCCNQHENDHKNFAYAETSSCSWALWPCGQVFKCLDCMDEACSSTY